MRLNIWLCLLLWLFPVAGVLADNDNRELVGAENRIVGGSNAVSGEFPFFVQGWKCGATLVWHDVILSSGHCEGKLNFEDNRKVLVGPHLNRKTKGGAQWRKVVQEQVHPQYNASNQNYDFLIAKLDRPVTGKKLKPIKLNRKRKKPTPGTKLTTIGFGDRFYEAKTEPKVLQKVTVETFSWEECTGNYRSVADDVTIYPETEFCAGDRSGGKDSCDGDSGSSIFQYTKKGPMLIGVTAWGINCGKKNSPGVYVRVSSVMDWIQDQICRLSSRPPLYCKKIIPPDSYRIQVKYDFFPTETSWSLTEFETRKPILDYPAGSVTGELYLANEYVDLDPRKRYLLSVRDSYGDGIKGGWVKVSKLSGGIDKQTVLYIDDVSQDRLTYTLFSGPNDYRIDFYYGKDPELVSWSLRGSSGTVILEQNFKAYANYHLFSEIFALPPGEEYILSIIDESGDSLKEGEIRIFSLRDGFDEEVLYLPGAEVGSGEEFRFRG